MVAGLRPRVEVLAFVDILQSWGLGLQASWLRGRFVVAVETPKILKP